MKMSMVVAMGPKREIGLQNKLLWHIKSDLQNFKKITTGKIVVMGRKTFESIGRPLPNRENIVITRSPDFQREGIKVINDPLMLLDYVLEKEEELGEDLEVMIIGGAEIYSIYLPYTSKIYLSKVDYTGPADAFFPEYNPTQWECVHKEAFPEFQFEVLVKI